jgi:hypothetical protein
LSQAGLVRRAVPSNFSEKLEYMRVCSILNP